MRRQEKWQSIIGPILVDTSFELVGVECVGGGKHTVVRIYIDKPGGINLDDIVHLSRQISVVLDVEEPIKGHYTLEVSSPGLERPLFTAAHFKQQIGQKVFVKTSLAVSNRQNFKGMLLDANEKEIQLDVDGQNFTFAYEDIDKAKVVPDIKITGSK
ncbi:MAG: ribosome maturation factor RimP [Gammaproteobacteria bacterium]|jgi:ribosome maturation factor RimP|nr:ribosome maturation factor RimP [Gammaproteobacteria bacterium]